MKDKIGEAPENKNFSGVKMLDLLSIGYLALPMVIFAAGFLQAWIALPLIALLLLAIVFSFDGGGKVERRLLLISFGLAIVMLLMTGFPNGPWTWDWVKHWTLLNELSDRSWPLSLDYKGQSLYLRFYIGIYLVPALMQKMFPFLGIGFLFGLWVFLGFVLVFYMIAGLARSWKGALIAGFVFILIGGAEFWVTLFLRDFSNYATPAPFSLYYETWYNQISRGPLQIPSFATSMIWTPHQAIATFIAAGFLLNAFYRGGLGRSMLSYGLLALWSPYGMISLFPIVLACLWRHRTEFLMWRAWAGMAAGGIVTLVIIVYLAREVPSNGALCLSCFVERVSSYRRIAWLLLVETLPYLLLLGRDVFRRPLCLISFLTLALLPCISSSAGDLVMRGTAGPLFVLGLYAVHRMLQIDVGNERRMIHVIALLLCAPVTIAEVVYVQTEGRAHKEMPRKDPMRRIIPFAKKTDYRLDDYLKLETPRILPQYFSKNPPWLTRKIPAAQPEE